MHIIYLFTNTFFTKNFIPAVKQWNKIHLSVKELGNCDTEFSNSFSFKCVEIIVSPQMMIFSAVI